MPLATTLPVRPVLSTPTDCSVTLPPYALHAPADSVKLEEPVLEPSQIIYTVPLDGNAVMTWAPEGSPTPAQPELLPFGPVVGFRCE